MSVAVIQKLQVLLGLEQSKVRFSDVSALVGKISYLRAAFNAVLSSDLMADWRYSRHHPYQLIKRRALGRLLCYEGLEDSRLLAVTNLSSGILSIDFEFVNEAVTVSNDGANISLTGSTFTGYYKGSSFASNVVDNALDPSKVLVQSAAAPQTLSYSNLINTTRGINGIVLDVAGLASASLTASDFGLHVSPTGFFDEAANPPSSWAAAPSPTGIFVTPGTGSNPARVRLEWADNAIENRWLQIRILANANTGLLSSQVYYLGHLRGEINGQTIGGAYFVNNADLTAALPVGQVALVGNTRDVDKNGFVLNADFIIVRLGIINGLVLRNITIPAAGSADKGGFGMRPFNRLSPLPPITPIVVATPLVVEQSLAIATLDPAPRRLDRSIPQSAITARRGAIADQGPFLQHTTQTKADGKLVGLVDDFFANLGRQRLIPISILCP